MGTEVVVRRLDVGAERVTAAATAAGVCRILYAHEGRAEWRAWRARFVPDAEETSQAADVAEGADRRPPRGSEAGAGGGVTPGEPGAGDGYAATPTGPAMWLDLLERELAAYLAGEARAFTVPVDLRGTPFQVRVWEALRDVPYGATITYGDVAAEVAGAGAVRAVGRAVGANPVPMVVPCHRVLGRDGGLTGYGGGLPRKRMLLRLEGVALPGDAPARTVQQRLQVGDGGP